MTTAVMAKEGWSANFGVFDVDAGVEVIAPNEKYNQLGALTPDLFFFSTSDAPQIPGPLASLSTLGLMDRSGKVLIEPARFSRIAPDDDGKYLLARGDGVSALLDLNGKELIAPKWAKLEIDKRLNIIFGYDAWEGDEGETSYVLRAAYALDGKPLFSVNETDCGAEQLLDGAGKVVWPQDAKLYCSE
jgi:hypothetical protein